MPDEYDHLDTFQIWPVEGAGDIPILFCNGCGNGVEAVLNMTLSELITAAEGHRCNADDEPVSDAR